MKINCPQCGATLKVVVYSADDVHTCPKCSAQFRTGGTRGASAKPAAPAPDDDWLNEVGATPPSKPTAPSPPAPPSPAPPPPARPSSARPTPARTSDDRRVELPPLKIDLDDDSPSPAPPSSRTSPTQPATRTPARPAAAAPVAPAPLDNGPLDDGPLGPLPADPLGTLDPPPPLALDAGRYAFSVDCRVCGTRMDFESDQIGSEVVCPDCETRVLLTEPSPARRRPLHQVDETDFSRLRGEECAPATAQLETPEVQKKRADDLLKRAEQAIDDEVANQPDEFDDKSTKALFQFLFEPATLTRMAGLAAAGCLTLGLFSAVYAARGAPSMSDLFNIFLYALIGPVLVGWLLALGAHVVAVFRDTANGSVSIQSWPEIMSGGLLFDGLFPSLAIFLSMIPSVALSMLAGAFGATLGTLVGILTFVPSVLLLTPLIFLSMMSDNSLTTLFRPKVWKAMLAAGQSTVTFYIASFVLVVLLHAGLHLVLIGNLIVQCVVSFVMVLDAFVYFRLLGWLAGRCREAFEEEYEEEESA